MVQWLRSPCFYRVLYGLLNAQWPPNNRRRRQHAKVLHPPVIIVRLKKMHCWTCFIVQFLLDVPRPVGNGQRSSSYKIGLPVWIIKLCVIYIIHHMTHRFSSSSTSSRDKLHQVAHRVICLDAHAAFTFPPVGSHKRHFAGGMLLSCYILFLSSSFLRAL